MMELPSRFLDLLLVALIVVAHVRRWNATR
ncbi:hypothetical protein DFR50_10939 [Roseiarcus fermentans]|uniref:Uncharacterized protein n=1 Tax=Roseiarcus fermentans TaxID=1473586 RepID=A0A366FJJ7_9HYPH|nr:hypothetical protein DFR50_10939 [Roseiarcus fermentans]